MKEDSGNRQESASVRERQKVHKKDSVREGRRERRESAMQRETTEREAEGERERDRERARAREKERRARARARHTHERI